MLTKSSYVLDSGNIQGVFRERTCREHSATTEEWAPRGHEQVSKGNIKHYRRPLHLPGGRGRGRVARGGLGFSPHRKRAGRHPPPPRHPAEELNGNAMRSLVPPPGLEPGSTI